MEIKSKFTDFPNNKFNLMVIWGKGGCNKKGKVAKAFVFRILVMSCLNVMTN